MLQNSKIYHEFITLCRNKLVYYNYKQEFCLDSRVGKDCTTSSVDYIQWIQVKSKTEDICEVDQNLLLKWFFVKYIYI